MKSIFNVSFTVLITMLVMACSSSRYSNERRCATTIRNGFKIAFVDDFVSVVSGDTVIINEVKYECNSSALTIKKGMYDRFGKWDEAVYPEGKRFPILVWKNVNLFPQDTTTFTVAANGEESRRTIYTSVMVFDAQNNDVLGEDSTDRQRLIEYFSEMIQTDDPGKRKFYEIYWKDVDPERWAQIKRYWSSN